MRVLWLVSQQLTRGSKQGLYCDRKDLRRGFVLTIRWCDRKATIGRDIQAVAQRYMQDQKLLSCSRIKASQGPVASDGDHLLSTRHKANPVDCI